MKRTKTKILQSIIALLGCFAMLIGSTFAWFTDSVSSMNNIITSGNLDLEMYWTDDLNGTWYNVEDAAYNTVFSYDNWEPGYTDVKYIKLVNKGALALNYQLSLTPQGGVGKLADVINVYFANEGVAFNSREDLYNMGAVGLLSHIMNGNVTANGTLLAADQYSPLGHPSGEIILTVAMNMLTTAGNEYQNETTGNFTITALATQAPVEEDSFGSDYDADAEFPVILPSTSVSAPVTPVDGKVPAGGVTMTDGVVSATLPEGVKLVDGANKVTLKVTPLESSSTDITVLHQEILIPVDVHIDGVAEDNTVPIVIELGPIMPKYLNIGNYALIHVEDGVNYAMTRVADVSALNAHNQFTYIPETGAVTVSMASFSEVAIVSKEVGKWEGNRDYSWYTNAVAPVAEGEPDYTISNADQLAGLSAIVGGMDGQTQNSFAGKTIKLLADINLGDKERENNPNVIFYPVGYYNSEGTYERTNTAITSGLRNFEGTFDGNGHTVSNFYQNTWEMKGDHDWYSPQEQYYRDGMGLFGRVYKGTIKNLTVDNFSSDGEITTTGSVAAYADGATFENIAITNCNPRVYNIGNGGIVGCVGWYAKEVGLKTTFKNITVDNSNKISALWGSYDVACGGIVGQYYPTSGQSSATYPVNAGIDLVNCHVSAIMDVYNDVCANYQYYAYRYAGMLIGSIRENETINGHVYPKMDGITASGCTVNFGTWNDYYYCEFEKNGHPSYSGPDDYKFSRIPHSEINFTDSNGNGVIDTEGERASVTGCKHTHTKAEDQQCVYLEFNNLFTGYGWGVTSKGLKDFEGVETMRITESDIDKSVDKFEWINGSHTLNNGTPYTIGALFEAKSDLSGMASINSASVSVTVSSVDPKNPTVSGTYIANKDDWEQGTLEFFGTGDAYVTITDYTFCNKLIIPVTVVERQPEEKFTKLFNNDYLYRVGNGNAVSLNSLFKEKVKDAVSDANVSVTFETVAGASGTYTSNSSDWTKGTLQFSGTGVVKVTIKDNDTYCKPTELILEVVDAWNSTGATSAPYYYELTKTYYSVVLLNNCSLSSLAVSGRYTFYGNGFTATYSGNGQYLNNGLKQGVVTVSENGTLDNLRIVAPIYPAAYMYYGSTSLGEYVQGGPSSVDGDKTRYHYQLSAVAASGNATIQNCYIYGGRNNIFVNTGDVTIKDTVLECGTVANVQVQSNASHTITLEDVTTIQYPVNATIGDTTKVMLGGGVIVGPDTTENPKFVLNGDFKQYNWVTEEDKNAVSGETAKLIIGGALNATAFNHTVNGKNASNLGIVYMNAYAATVINNTGLPYKLDTIKMTVSGVSVNGQAYSLQGATANQIYSDYANADKSTINGLYEPQFKYPADLGGQYIEKDSGDEHCYREGDTIHVMFPSGDTKELDLAKLVNIVKYTGQNLNLVIACKDGNGNPVTVTGGKVTLSAADEYAVTYTVTDTLFYDKNGQKITGSEEYSWNVTVSVSLKDTAIPNARFEFDATKQKMGYYKPSWGDVKQYLPFLAGLKIYDYNGKTEYLRFDGSSDFNKVASITITGYASNKASVEIKLTDGGVINTQFLARANSGGAATYTGKIKTSNSVIYFVNDGGTSNSDKTTTAAYWYVDFYKFTGNNGVAIQSGQQTFNSSGSSASTPSGNFSTSIKSTVTYDANGGNCGQTTSYATNVAAAVTLPTPSRSGYIFAGWYTAASGGTRVGGAGESYTPSANIKLYAQWGKPCTVTYNANGGSCGTASAKYTGTALTLPTPTRDGYWFIGWYDAADGGNKIGDAGKTYNPTGDITLYARWQEAISYTVTYNANGGTCGTASATYQGAALALPTPTRTGYKFLGWYTATSGGTKIGDAGASYTPSANIALYAQWEQISYTITISKQDNATVTVDKTTAHYNDTISVTVSFSQSNNRTLTVKDASGNTILSKSAAGTYTFTMPDSNVTISASSEKSCVTGDTLVMLADGTQKRIDEITYEDQLLVWNFFTGEYDAVPSAIIFYHGDDIYRVLNLRFEDGTVVKVINNHGFFDVEANKFVFIEEANVTDYIGRSFVKVVGEDRMAVKLVDYSVTEEYTGCYSIQTAVHINFMTEGMFSETTPPYDGWFEYFEIGDGMKYDEAKMQADLETYGQYEYSDFAAYATYEQFIAFNGPYLKVLVGRGVLTFEELLELVATYVS